MTHRTDFPTLQTALAGVVSFDTVPSGLSPRPPLVEVGVGTSVESVDQLRTFGGAIYSVDFLDSIGRSNSGDVPQFDLVDDAKGCDPGAEVLNRSLLAHMVKFAVLLIN